MHPVSVFRRKPVAELTVRQAANYKAPSQPTDSPWLLKQASTGDWSAQAPDAGATRSDSPQSGT